ncbi:DNA polymerase III subunit gamma/tau [Cardiobacteriaceae bacterium TAE3-ERU3]|nr:DNA polymerase III subunit gamma/tau [Cardiobacteriaceae bacterium TAE3-ERU3]
MYQVLARKWRPKNFHELVGQQHVTQALTYALDHDRIHHAYLFTGTRGVGKTTIARIFAKSLNCLTNGVSAEPCGECEHCREIDQGRFPDLIEVDAASRTGVDDTRELLDNVPYAPVKGRYKVYLIDEVHMFSRSSFNALLKTLEEPPKHVKFILATTDPQKMPATVLSRCLQFHLKNMTSAQIVAHLQAILDHDNIEYEQDGLKLLAEAGSGSMRDSLSLLDQAIAYGRGAISSKDVAQLLGAVPAQQLRAIMGTLADADAPALRGVLHTLDEFAPDYQDLLKRLLYQLQEVTIAQLDAERFSGEIDDEIKLLAERLPVELVQLWYQIATDGWQSLAYQPDVRLAVEMILLRMIALRPLLPTADPATLREIPPVAPASPGKQVETLDDLEAMLKEKDSDEASSAEKKTDELQPVVHNAVQSGNEVNQVQAAAPPISDDELPPPWVSAPNYGDTEVSHEPEPSTSFDHGEENEADSEPVKAIDSDNAMETKSPVVTTNLTKQQDADRSAVSNFVPNDENVAPEEMASAKVENASPDENIEPVPEQVQAQEEPTEYSSVKSERDHAVLSDAEPEANSNNQRIEEVSIGLDDCAKDPYAWAQLTTILDLPGAAGVIAEHSVVLGWHPPQLTLGLADGAMMLAGEDETIALLSESLTAYTQAKCEVVCVADAAHETPAILQEQAIIDERNRAEAAMHAHPVVKDLQRRLGAVIVPGSIVSLKPKYNRS